MTVILPGSMPTNVTRSRLRLLASRRRSAAARFMSSSEMRNSCSAIGGTGAEPIRPAASASRITSWQVTTVRRGSRLASRYPCPWSTMWTMSRVEVAHEARIDREPARRSRRSSPTAGERARQASGTTPGGRTRVTAIPTAEERLAQPLRVEAHAGLLLVAVVVEHGDAQRPIPIARGHGSRKCFEMMRRAYCVSASGLAVRMSSLSHILAPFMNLLGTTLFPATGGAAVGRCSAATSEPLTAVEAPYRSSRHENRRRRFHALGAVRSHR